MEDEDKNKMYNIMEDEYKSEPSYIRYGEIYLKTYSKEKIKQYLDRTYWGWKFYSYVRCPNYYEIKDISSIRSIYFVNKRKINIKFREKYERKIKREDILKLEEELIKYYKIHKYKTEFD